MLVTKIFDTQINLTNINDIYSKNLDDLLLDILKEKYDSTCYKSCFVKTVDKIINRSIPTIDKRSLTAYVNIYISFECTVLYYEYLDVLLDNEVINMSYNKVNCMSENKYILINNKNKILDSININQKIPILVGKCSYKIYKNVISINAFPFIPILENKNNVYYKIEELTDDEKNILNTTIMVDINEEHKLRDILLKDKKNKLSYFTKLLYPFKEELYKKKTTYINNFDLLDLDTVGVVSLLNEMPLENHNISLINQTIYNKENKNKDDKSILEKGDINNPFVENSLTIYQIYLNKYYKYIKLIRELSESYSDDKYFTDNKNIFEIYNENKF